MLRNNANPSQGSQSIHIAGLYFPVPSDFWPLDTLRWCRYFLERVVNLLFNVFKSVSPFFTNTRVNAVTWVQKNTSYNLGRHAVSQHFTGGGIQRLTARWVGHRCPRPPVPCM